MSRQRIKAAFKEMDMRKTGTDEDLTKMLADRRLLVAIDAALPNRLTVEDVRRLAYDALPYTPDGLDPVAFARLTFKIVDMMNKGEVVVPADAKAEFAHFYTVVSGFEK